MSERTCDIRRGEVLCKKGTEYRYGELQTEIFVTRGNDLKSVRRALDVLTAMAASTSPRTFTDLCSSVGMSKATANRLLSTLESGGMVRRHPDTGKYTLGLTALRIGTAAGNQIQIRRDLRVFLTELMEMTGETSNLVMFERTQPVFIDNAESVHSLRIYSRVGREASPYCTAAGKALLAFQPEPFVEQVLETVPFERRAPNSIVTREACLEELVRIRERGYAVDDEEGEIGARCVGAPVLNQLGVAVAALSVSGPSTRVTREQVPRLAAIVCEVAARAQRSLGVMSQTETVAWPVAGGAMAYGAPHSEGRGPR